MQKEKNVMEHFSEKFPLLQRLYDLYQATEHFSKSEDNTLRKSSEITILEIIELVVIATRQEKHEKLSTFRQIKRKVDALEVFMNMSVEVGSMATKPAQEFKEIIDSVNKMIGGWEKACEDK